MLRWLLMASALLLPLDMGPQSPPAVPLAGVLARAAQYVAEYEKTLSVLICDENYAQVVRVRHIGMVGTGPTSGTFTDERVQERRRLRSEFMFIWVPANSTWLGFRDVIEVDGRRVADRQGRLESLLLQQGNTAYADLRRLSDESARFNVGAIYRNFNEPTLGLLLLDSSFQPRFVWEKARETTIDGVRAWEVRFKERATPTVIRRGDQDLFAAGSVWIDPVTGRLLRTRLVVEEPGKARGRGTITVQYELDRKLGMFVPSQMKELYEDLVGATGSRIECTATYSRFRRFETDVRLVVPKR